MYLFIYCVFACTASARSVVEAQEVAPTAAAMELNATDITTYVVDILNKVSQTCKQHCPSYHTQTLASCSGIGFQEAADIITRRDDCCRE
jgi:hypothetical protein